MKKRLLFIVSFTILIFGGLTTQSFAQNLLPNGGFEEAIDPATNWNNLVGAGGYATYTLETTGSPEGVNHMKIDVDTLGANGWSIQSINANFTVVKDSTYKVVWKAKGSADTLTINHIFADGEGQQFGGRKTITTDWQTYQKEWVAKASGDAEIKFWWEKTGEYYIDSVVVVDPTYDPGLTPQTIDFPAIDDKFTTAGPFDITVTASSGLPVTLVITGPATLDGNTVTLTGDPGTVKITASQAGDDTYNPATDVEQSFDVTIEGWVYEQTLEEDVKFTLETPTIDGVANEPEWGYVTGVSADTYFNDANNEPNYFTENPSNDDLSAIFKVLWSESGIYVYADITDEVIHTDSADIKDNGGAHQYDNIEVFMHLPVADWDEDLKASSDYVSTTFQLRSNIGMSGEHWSGRDGQGYTSSRLDNLYTYAFAQKAGGVTFEAFYPFETLLGGSTAANPSRLGMERSILFEFTYGDSDGTGTGGVRSGGVSWNSIPDILDSYSGVAHNNRKQFGKINLTSTIAEPTSVDFNTTKSIYVYPSIFEDHISIQSEYKVVEVRLYNALGKELLHKNNPDGIEYVNQLDALNSGLYFLKMKSDNKISTVKIIKQ